MDGVPNQPLVTLLSQTERVEILLASLIDAAATITVSPYVVKESGTNTVSPNESKTRSDVGPSGKMINFVLSIQLEDRKR